MDQKTAINKAIALISNENSIPEVVKQDLLATLKPAASPLQWDPWIYRMVVGFLGMTVLSTVIGGMVIMATSGSNISEGIIALGSAAVGALAGLLAPSPKGNQ
ncbi:hypothetical protein GCM10027046_11680 [Uliginosibacterium flavum]|uniref:Holin n=1 Tax=Uliginosibacterium flavum TaxID=1396831 RepID=A0ABV2TRK9_9RHOO